METVDKRWNAGEWLNANKKINIRNASESSKWQEISGSYLNAQQGNCRLFQDFSAKYGFQSFSEYSTVRKSQ